MRGRDHRLELVALALDVWEFMNDTDAGIPDAVDVVIRRRELAPAQAKAFRDYVRACCVHCLGQPGESPADGVPCFACSGTGWKR